MTLHKRTTTAKNGSSNKQNGNDNRSLTTTTSAPPADPTRTVRQAARKRQQAKQQQKQKQQHKNSFFSKYMRRIMSGLRNSIGFGKDGTRRSIGGLHPLTVQGSVVLLLAIIGALYANHYQHNYNITNNHNSHTNDLQVQSLLQSMGKAVLASSSILLEGRTHVTVRDIPHSSTPILSIPRKWLVWDIDALMDPFIQHALIENMMPATRNEHEENQEIIIWDSDVFLAAYLAKEWKLLDTDDKQKNHNNNPRNITTSLTQDPVLRKYLRALPSLEEYQHFHPVFWNHHQLAPLRRTSAAHDLIQHYQEALHASYDALVQASPTVFGELVSRNDYATARLHVWTRSFGTGVLLKEVDDEDPDIHHHSNITTRTGQAIPDHRWHEWHDLTGRDIRQQGCHSMVPILDLYNHHASPNVGFVYDTREQAFLVQSTRAIPAGHEIIDSYGKHSEAHLLAKYGLVNADGSDWTQASLAVYHAVYSHGLPKELVGTKEGRIRTTGRLLRYLQLDDGYDACVTDDDDNDDAWQLKVLKFQHLRRIAREPTRWNVFVHPRTTTARPPQSSTHGITSATIPTLDPQTVQLDINPVLATCRLLVLTHHDYNGTATTLLRENLENAASFRLPGAHGDALQFRELMCLLRLADMALRSYETPLEQAKERLQALLDAKVEQDSLGIAETSEARIEWMSRYVIYSEMEALHVIKDLAAQLLHQSFGPEGSTLLNSEAAYTMQQTPCPILHELLDYVD